MVLLAIQITLSRKMRALVKGRITYLGEKRVNDTYCLEGYEVKISGCAQMILVQQEIGCNLGKSHMGVWGVCERRYTPRQARKHLGNKDSKCSAKLCSTS